MLENLLLQYHLDQSVFLFCRESILFSLFFFLAVFKVFNFTFYLSSFTEMFIGNLFLFILFGTLNAFWYEDSCVSLILET